MHQLYRRVKSAIINLYFWIWDYIYVVYWQVLGLVRGYDAKKYIVAGSKDTIILIPGIYEKWQFMKPIADLLHAHGHSVHVIESLGYNTSQIEVMAQRIQEYVESNHIERYNVVAHSKGGLIAKYMLGINGHAINKVITINTPFRGSIYAGLFPFKSIRLFLPTSALLVSLAKDMKSNNKITSIYSVFDPHIPGGSYLEGATNIQLKTGGHFRIINDSKVHEAILNNLE